MKKNDSTKQVVAFYVAIVLLFVAVTIAVADNPVSRITAEPEWLDLNEEDDGKFALFKVEIACAAVGDSDSVVSAIKHGFREILRPEYRSRARG
mgnify:CR=1 FL=1